MVSNIDILKGLILFYRRIQIASINDVLSELGPCFFLDTSELCQRFFYEMYDMLIINIFYFINNFTFPFPFLQTKDCHLFYINIQP